jgi:hypothetical protein
MRSVWVDMYWVDECIHQVEQISLPLKFPYHQSTFKVMYQLRLERVDNTMVDIVWKAETANGLELLGHLYQTLWNQMDSLLTGNEVVSYDELWEAPYQLLQPTHTYANLLG